MTRPPGAPSISPQSSGEVYRTRFAHEARFVADQLEKGGIGASIVAEDNIGQRFVPAILEETAWLMFMVVVGDEAAQKARQVVAALPVSRPDQAFHSPVLSNAGRTRTSWYAVVMLGFLGICLLKMLYDFIAWLIR